MAFRGSASWPDLEWCTLASPEPSSLLITVLSLSPRSSDHVPCASSADCLSHTPTYKFQEGGHAVCVPLSTSPQTCGWDIGDPQKVLDEQRNVCTGTPFLDCDVLRGCHSRHRVDVVMEIRPVYGECASSLSGSSGVGGLESLWSFRESQADISPSTEPDMGLYLTTPRP